MCFKRKKKSGAQATQDEPINYPLPELPHNHSPYAPEWAKPYEEMDWFAYVDGYRISIRPGVLPPKEGFDVLNKDEQRLFSAFLKLLKDAGFNPNAVRLERLSGGMFNVNYGDGKVNCYVGKIDVSDPPPAKYAVVKQGASRATKVFDTREEADGYVASRIGYDVVERRPRRTSYMQYLVGVETIKEASGLSLDEYIAFLYRWVNYIKYC